MKNIDHAFIVEYSKRAIKTAKYPNIGNNIIYPVLGLVDEIGETIEKLFDFDGVNLDSAVDEFGDVLWYLNQVHYEVNCFCKSIGYIWYNFSNLVEMTLCDSGYCVTYSIDYNLISKKMFVYCSKLVGAVKKAIRDNNGILQREKLPYILNNYLEILRWYQRWIDYINTKYSSITTSELSIVTIAIRNITKLEDRLNRNVIKGDGDKR